jgi:tetratricopeptide (TPR) repeat protein
MKAPKQQVILWLLIGLSLTALGTWRWYLPWRGRAGVEDALAKGSVGEASERARRLVRSYPDDWQARRLLARAEFRAGRSYEAAAALHEARKLGLPEEQARVETAIQGAAGDFVRFEPILKQALEHDADDVDVVEALARGYSGAHRWVEAETACNRWIELQPNRIEVYTARGKIRQELKAYHQAIDDFAAAVRLAPDDFAAHLQLANGLLSDARIEETERELQWCRRMEPKRPEPLVGLASCAIEHGKLDEAQRFLDQALALDPNNGPGLHEQGNLYLLRRQWPKAVLVYEHILQLDDRDKHAHLKLAQALRSQGDLSRAETHRRRFEELDRGQIMAGGTR